MKFEQSLRTSNLENTKTTFKIWFKGWKLLRASLNACMHGRGALNVGANEATVDCISVIFIANMGIGCGHKLIAFQLLSFNNTKDKATSCFSREVVPILQRQFYSAANYP